MNRKKMMLTTVALGTAYLFRNQKSRKNLMNQFQAFSGKVKR